MISDITNGQNSRLPHLADEAALWVHALLEHDAGPALVVAADEVVGVEHGYPVHGEPKIQEAIITHEVMSPRHERIQSNNGLIEVSLKFFANSLSLVPYCVS